jgi:uncharacterized protein (DUF1330 family)
MAVFLVLTMKLHDTSWVAEYQKHVPGIFRKHGGEFVAVSETVRLIEGDGPVPDRIAIATFPSMDEVDAFFSDPDYQPFKAARLLSASGNAFGITTRE